MNISSISLRDLEYLVALGTHLHFGKAAESCHVSQPGLSAQIRKVEEFLGVMVFERSKRSVQITEQGSILIQQAKVVLEEAKKMATFAQAQGEPLTGSLRVGAIASLGPYLIPHLLRPLRKRFKKLELLLKEGLTESLIADLRAGTLDVVLASPTFDESGLRQFPLFFEPFVLAAPHGHRLVDKRQIRSGDLKTDEMVLLEDGHCLKDQTLDICPVNRRGKIQRFHATSLETLRHLVASGLGYTLIPALARGDDKRLDGLVEYRPFEEKTVGRTVSLYCRERFAQMAGAELLSQFIRENLPKSVMPLR